jgi:hypothetical protein
MNYERNLTIGVDGYTNDELVFVVYGDTSLDEDVSVGGNLNIVGILTANRIFSNVYGEFTGSSIIGDTIVGSSLIISGITTLNKLNVVDINSSGIITSTRLSTGNIGTAINITSDTITGPSTIIIDPSGIGDATGSVRIKGDLYVDGTNFLLNKIDIDDFGVGIATQISSNIILDGAGIGIGSDNIKKSLTYEYDSDSLKSSENFDLADGKAGHLATAPGAAHLALCQPGRHCHLGRAGLDPHGLGAGWQAGLVLCLLCGGCIFVPQAHAPAACQ